MKPEEALKNIGDWISNETRQRKYDKATVIELSDSLITLKVAVNKQVPKLAIWEGPYNDAKDDAEAYCPNNECNYALDAEDWSFCPKCGTSVVFHQDEVQKMKIEEVLEEVKIQKAWRKIARK